MNKILNPCVACGNEAILVARHEINGRLMFYVECKKCAAKTGDFRKDTQAIRAWNKEAKNDD